MTKEQLMKNDRAQRLAFRRILGSAALLATACLGFGACSGAEDGETTALTGGPADDEHLGLTPEDEGAPAQCVISDAFKSCFQSCQNAAVGPANLYIMFDSSQSMENDDKWLNATAAMDAFFADPASAGLGVALRFFPDSGCDEMSCNVEACSQPTVPLGHLSPESSDPHRMALRAALDKKYPFGGTPMHPALEGALQWAKHQLASEEVQRPVVVLVTDGAPFGCHTDPDDVNIDVENIAKLAEEAYSEHGIFTYVVGLEGSWEWIVNKIAAAGGTGKAMLVSNESTYDELFAAFQAIKESHVDCEVALPADDLTFLDPNQVNVTYTPGGAAGPTILGQVADAASCDEKGGWYYDDPASPTKISLCPNTCSEVQADKGAKLDVIVGCETQYPR